MKIKHILIILAALSCLTACNTQKNNLPYFSDIQTIESGILDTMSYLPTIMPDDELSITVNSLSSGATVQYQMPLMNPAVTSELTKTSSPRFQTYIVDSKGYIKFPVLGEIHVAGLTTEQLAAYLTNEISKEVKDPVVDVRIVNFSITVGGEVKLRPVSP